MKILRLEVDLLEILARQLVMGIDPQSTLKMQPSLGELARFGQSAAQVGLRVSVVRMQADGSAIVVNCFEEFVLRDKGICQIVVRVKIVWLHPEPGMEIGDGFADSPRSQEERPQGFICATALRPTNNPT